MCLGLFELLGLVLLLCHNTSKLSLLQFDGQSHLLLTLIHLLLPGSIHLCPDTNLLLVLSLLLPPVLSLTLLISPFGSELIDLTLSIGQFLLGFSESLDLPFLLHLSQLLLPHLLKLSKLLLSVVPGDGLVLLFLLLDLIHLYGPSLLVDNLCLHHGLSDHPFPGFGSQQILRLRSLHGLDHHFGLSFLFVQVLETILASGSNLVLEALSSSDGGCLLISFLLVLSGQGLESLNLHHQVNLLLLLDVLLL